jgi:hypothetical protein
LTPSIAKQKNKQGKKNPKVSPVPLPWKYQVPLIFEIVTTAQSWLMGLSLLTLLFSFCSASLWICISLALSLELLDGYS